MWLPSRNSCKSKGLCRVLEHGDVDGLEKRFFPYSYHCRDRSSFVQRSFPLVARCKLYSASESVVFKEHCLNKGIPI